MQAGDSEVLTRAYLVFENARKFNIDGRDIHTYATELKGRFNKALDKVMRSHPSTPTHNPHNPTTPQPHNPTTRNPQPHNPRPSIWTSHPQPSL